MQEFEQMVASIVEKQVTDEEKLQALQGFIYALQDIQAYLTQIHNTAEKQVINQ